MQDIASDDVINMVDHEMILSRINQNERRGLWLPWLGACTTVLTCSLWSGVGLVIGLACIVLGFWLRHYLAGRSPVELTYEFSEEDTAKYGVFQHGLTSFERCQRVWQVNAFGKTSDWKRNGGAGQTIKRSLVRVGRGTPRSFRANVEVFHLKLDRETLYLLPDMVFVQQRRTMGSVAYTSLLLAESVVAFHEEEAVPSDTQLIGTTWRFINKNGGPDRRFNNNRQIPVVRYGDVALRSDSGLRLALMTSSPEAARSFTNGIKAMQGDVSVTAMHLRLTGISDSD